MLEKNFHRVANFFPMMTDDEFQALKADIQRNGQINPVWLHPEDGSIIDGRNRYRACQDLGIEPEFRTWAGNGSLVEFVVSMNLRRRHLSSGQMGALSLDLLPELEAEALERQQAARHVNGRQNGYHADLVESYNSQPKGSREPQSRDTVAKLLGISNNTVAYAKKIARESPTTLEKMRTGEINVEQAKRIVKEEKREVIRNNNRSLVADTQPVATPSVDSRYQTIVLDPPWDWGDEGDADQYGRARPTYGTMTIEQITDLPVASLSEKDAHIYLWITNRSLPKGFDLLAAWGFRYVTCLTWCKPSIGMGNYYRGSTEQILFGVKGSLPLLRNDVGTWFNAQRGERHSAKPSEFYAMVESCSPGPWLEMFARANRPGWATWGAEA